MVIRFHGMIPGANICLELVYLVLNIQWDLLSCPPFADTSPIRSLRGCIFQSFGSLEFQSISTGNFCINYPVYRLIRHDIHISSLSP